MNIKQFLFLPALTLLAFASCEQVAPEARWVDDTSHGEVASTLLVEEYTGQKCLNCPRAAERIHEYLKPLGAGSVVVAMHAERTGMTLPELASEEANVYAEAFGHPRVVPGIMLDRKPLDPSGAYLQQYALWANLMRQLKSATPRYSMDLTASYDATTRQYAVTTSARRLGTPVAGETMMIQLWVVEDIKAPQYLQTGDMVKDFQHHNVLRAALNGVWGEPYQLGTEYKHEYPLPAKVVDPKNTKVVAFIYEAATRQVQAVKLFALSEGGAEVPIENPNKIEIPENTRSKATLWLFDRAQNVYISGDEIICTTYDERLKDDEPYSMKTPMCFVVPGTEHGAGRYKIVVRKLDHLTDTSVGLHQVCYGMCFPCDDVNQYEYPNAEVKNVISYDQSLFIHYELTKEAYQAGEDHRASVEFVDLETGKVAATFKLVFRPGAKS